MNARPHPIDRWIAAVCARPWISLTACVAIALAAGVGMSRLRIVTDGRILQPASSAFVQNEREHEARFGASNDLLLLVDRPDPGAPRVDDAEGFARLAMLHDRVAAVPGVISHRVLDASALPVLLETAATIRVVTYRDQDPALDAATLRERLRDHALGRGLLLDPSGQRATMLIPIDPDGDRTRIVGDIQRTVAAMPDDGWRRRLLGQDLSEIVLAERVQRDLLALIPLVIAIMALILAIALRCVAGVVAPLLNAGLCIVATVGALGLIGMPITILTSMVPVLLTTFAVTDDVYLIGRLRRHLGDLATVAALQRTYRELLPSIVATHLTTAVGFLTFLFATQGPIADFGLALSIGMCFGFVFSAVFLPAILVVMPRRWLGDADAGVARIAIPSGPLPCAAAIVVAAILIAGIGRLRIHDAWTENFAASEPMVEAERDFNRSFWGASATRLLVDGGRDGRFHADEGLALLARLAADPALARLSAHPVSLLDLVAAPPRDSALSVGERLLLAESYDPGLLRRAVTADGRFASVVLWRGDNDYAANTRFLADADVAARDFARDADVAVRICGAVPVGHDVVAAAVSGQAASLATAWGGVCLLTWAILRSLPQAIGVASCAGISAAATYGFMGWVGMPLGVATSMFGAQLIGVGVDFAIHVAAELGAPPRPADQAGLRRALDRVAPAVLANAAILGLGFSVLMASSLLPNARLGLLMLVGCSINAALAVLVLPTLSSAAIRKAQPCIVPAAA
ncbi:MAG TPA: MMPL family transporter [Planctomycetota bacterium]|nr:MMPL family transporter [Planctomycetota bacterium]